jgi:hypothetical protein
VLASNATATILPTVRMIAPYVPYSRWRLSSAAEFSGRSQRDGIRSAGD